ncbi:type II secretory pathway, ATPase PulE/Tfp pilus assembly pathway, ATPase PilB [Candidatus Magnetoovum chiemensis]|nr:type II secretory pathway, ATPase PulE/Tfp pilus assembly pathway, ATPase PilB [Candidatus Magnetoovum chiemensis]
METAAQEQEIKKTVDKKSLPLGEILVLDGFIKREQLKKALKIQEIEKKKPRPLAEVLYHLGDMDKVKLAEFLYEQAGEDKIRNALLENTKAPQDKIDAALERQSISGQFFGIELINSGLITEREFYKTITQNIEVPGIDDLLIKRGMIKPEDMERAKHVASSPRRVGDILVDEGYVENDMLQYVIEKYNKTERIGSILMREGYITEYKLVKALEVQKESNKRLGDVLVQLMYITKEQLYRAMSIQYSVPFIHIDKDAIERKTALRLKRLLNKKYSEKHKVVAVEIKEKDIIMAIDDIDSLKYISNLRKYITKYNLKACLVTSENLYEVHKQIYEGSSTGISLDSIDISYEGVFEDDEDAPKNKEDEKLRIKDKKVIDLVTTLLYYGIQKDASDIHFENDTEGLHIRYRIDGVLRALENKALSEEAVNYALQIVSRIKILANMDIAEKRLPQDGGFRLHYRDKQTQDESMYDFRVATIKGNGAAENITIRILDSQKVTRIGIEMLNLSTEIRNNFLSILEAPAGIMLITGPTGSGKSTTLYAALKHLYDPKKKIVTVEDPIEYTFPGVMQTQVNAKIEVTFARALRSFLRLDPDIMLVGEIRDEETASIAFKAAQTGHLLLSTLHTNDATAALVRLRDLSIDNEQITSSLMGVMAQRLIRTNCPVCTQEYEPHKKEWAIFFDHFPAGLNFRRGVGCSLCGGTGFKGRMIVCELFVPDYEINNIVRNTEVMEEVRAAARLKGMITMVEDGISKIANTTMYELYRIMPPHLIKEFKTSSAEKYCKAEKEKHLSLAAEETIYPGYGTIESVYLSALTNIEKKDYTKAVEELKLSSLKGYRSQECEELINQCYEELVIKNYGFSSVRINKEEMFVN